jgi:hypothetical protein
VRVIEGVACRISQSMAWMDGWMDSFTRTPDGIIAGYNHQHRLQLHQHRHPMPATKVFPDAGPQGPAIEDVAALIKQNKGASSV